MTLARLLVLSAVALVAAAQVSESPAGPPSAPPPPAVLIDPAHGGTDSGAMLNSAIPEKDVLLAVARRLRQELSARGMQAQLLRDSDSTISLDRRAEMVNSIRPGLYLAIHASSAGNGAKIYSALLPASTEGRGPFLDWQTAQSAALLRSRMARDLVTESLRKTGFPARGLAAPLRPLNNVVVPALGIEIAPTTGEVPQLASNDYQQMVCAALANAIAGLARAKGTGP